MCLESKRERPKYMTMGTMKVNGAINVCAYKAQNFEPLVCKGNFHKLVLINQGFFFMFYFKSFLEWKMETMTTPSNKHQSPFNNQG